MAKLTYPDLDEGERLLYDELLTARTALPKSDLRLTRAHSGNPLRAPLGRLWQQILAYDPTPQPELHLLRYLIETAEKHDCTTVDCATFPSLGKFRRPILSPIVGREVEVTTLRNMYDVWSQTI
ncbi:hypothetical protein ACWDSJ_31145 [Nocardia sp. NPDC003482]